MGPFGFALLSQGVPIFVYLTVGVLAGVVVEQRRCGRAADRALIRRRLAASSPGARLGGSVNPVPAANPSSALTGVGRGAEAHGRAGA